MSYPAKLSLSGKCPGCGGNLSRQTVDQTKPLGMVKCDGCAYSKTIQEFADGQRDAAKTAAQAKAAAAKNV